MHPGQTLTVNISSFVGSHPPHTWQYYFTKLFNFSLYHLERVLSATYQILWATTDKQRSVYEFIASGQAGTVSCLELIPVCFLSFSWHSLFQQTTLRASKNLEPAVRRDISCCQEQAVEASLRIIPWFPSDLDGVEYCDQPKCRTMMIGDFVNISNHTSK